MRKCRFWVGAVGNVAILCLVATYLLPKKSSSQSPSFTLRQEKNRRTISTATDYTVGDFIVAVDKTNRKIEVAHTSNTSRVFWKTIPNDNFIRAAAGAADIQDSRGHFHVKDSLSAETNQLTIKLATPVSSMGSDSLTIQGELSRNIWNFFHWEYETTVDLRYNLTMETVPGSSTHLAFRITIQNPDGSSNTSHNRILLSFHTTADEKFYGFGEQFTFLDMKGKAPTIIVSENGLGRGAISSIGTKLGTLLGKLLGVAGSYDNSYAPAPYYLTNRGHSIFLENYEISRFDLTDPVRVTVKVHSPEMRGRILHGTNPLELIKSYTEYTGRMAPLPDWINSGAIVGMQGGTDRVREVWGQLKALDTPMAAFWLQDWVGNRRTFAGKQLWWNWILNQNTYPHWSQLVADLENSGTRVMTYINPFLADLTGLDDYNGGEVLFEVARANGYFVQDIEGEPVLLPNTDFSAALLDLSNPEARTWIKSIIKSNLIETGCSGWMSDFGEGLPFDGVDLASGDSSETYHNMYPEEWAKLNKEAVAEANRTGDIVFFSRSGFTRIPVATTLLWEGDQTVLWDENDGLKSAITGLLSSGLSGMSLNHNDIGGYMSIEKLHISRSRELLFRWMEMNSFTAVFRTHEGNQPDANVQFYTDDETLQHFSKFAKVFAALAFYRSEVMQEAADKGYPIVRHPLLHFPSDAVVYDLKFQWMLGSEFLVAPVVDPGKTSVRVYLPLPVGTPSMWKHIWTGNLYAGGSWHTIEAPIGFPAVFFPEGSTNGETFRMNLQHLNVITRQ